MTDHRRSSGATRSLALVVCAALALLLMPPSASAQDHGGMCSGRRDPGLVVNALARARGDAPKYVLNLESDAAGNPTGVLVLGRGEGRILVEEWCRMWHHLPDQPYGECGDPGEGATTVHAVGTGFLRDGTAVRVRTDVRETEEGRFFRVRYRPPGDGHEAMEPDGDGCADEGWTRVPEEGWLPLDRVNVRIP